MTESTVAIRRRAPVTLVTLAALAALMTFATGTAAKSLRPAQPAEQTAPRAAGEPIMAIVSLASQQVTFYDADGWIVRAPVSTGITGRETPAGVFAVIEKDKDHHSSMYDDAWMPNMQRITWNGIALHGGPLPGYAASHGCIRMPYGFAEKMFDETRIGMRVIISPIDATPVAFSSPALFEPDPQAIAAAPTRAEALSSAAADAARAADAAKKAAVTAARESAALAKAVRNLERLKARADARLASAEKAVAAADTAQARARDRMQTTAAAVADLATQLDGARSEAEAKLAAATAAKDAAADDAARQAAAALAREAASLAKAVRRLEIAKTRADAKLASADKAVAAADQAVAQAETRKQTAAGAVADLATQLAAARAAAQSEVDAAAAAKDATKAADQTKAAASAAATEAKLALEPVSVYISRATRMLYVRRNTHKPWPDGGEVFDASIAVPVTIRDPDKPIGTHIFTAMAPAGAGLRWTAVTIDGGDTASDALDRITIPPDVLARIAPTVVPRSSIIVSDEPLSKETNYRTEFVAVLSNYPQGGFITRRPVHVPKDNFGFPSSADRNSGYARRRDPWGWLQPRKW